MLDLIAKTACDGMLPKTIGSVELTEIVPDRMVSVSPFHGQDEAVGTGLAALELVLPKVGRSQSKGAREIVWFGRGEFMLFGADAPEGLKTHAALTDQSDAWAVVQLKGDMAEAVLARLVPVDLRQSHVKRGHALRTQLNHMNVHITRLGNTSFRLMCFRSMAKTMVHELSEAMEAVRARG